MVQSGAMDVGIHGFMAVEMPDEPIIAPDVLSKAIGVDNNDIDVQHDGQRMRRILVGSDMVMSPFSLSSP